MKKLSTLSYIRHSQVAPIGTVLRREQREALEALYRRLVTCQSLEPKDSRRLPPNRSEVTSSVVPTSSAFVDGTCGRPSRQGQRILLMC